MPRKKNGEHMVVLSFKVDQRLLNEIDILAQQLRVTKSELIRAAIRSFIYGNKPCEPLVTKRIIIHSC